MKIALTVLFVMIQLLAVPAFAGDKPNIVYVLVDNWGWGDVGIQGSTTPTPRIDALAAEGMRFTNFNVQNQCTPTRSAIHTGRLPIRSGTQKVAAPENRMAWLLGNTRSRSCCRMPGTPQRYTASGTSARSPVACPTTRGMTNGGGSTKDRMLLCIHKHCAVRFRRGGNSSLLVRAEGRARQQD